MSRAKPQTIPVPRPDVESLTVTARALRERTEILFGERGEILDRAVTFRDLITLNLITEDQLSEIEENDRLDN